MFIRPSGSIRVAVEFSCVLFNCFPENGLGESDVPTSDSIANLQHRANAPCCGLRRLDAAAKLFTLRTWKSRSRNHPSRHLLVPAEIPTEGENQFG